MSWQDDNMTGLNEELEDCQDYSPDYEYEILRTNDPDGKKFIEMVKESYGDLIKKLGEE